MFKSATTISPVFLKKAKSFDHPVRYFETLQTCLLVDKKSHPAAVLAVGRIDRLKTEGISGYRERSFADLAKLCAPLQGRKLFVLYSQATCYFPSDRPDGSMDVFGGHASAFSVTRLDDKLSINPDELIISKVAGEPLTDKKSVTDGSLTLEGQGYTCRAHYEKLPQFNIFRGHGYQKKYDAIIPEFFIIFDPDRVHGLDLSAIARNYLSMQKTQMEYVRIGGSCGNCLVEAVIHEPFSGALPTQQAITEAGRHLVEGAGDSILECGYNRSVQELGIGLSPLEMGKLAQIMAKTSPAPGDTDHLTKQEEPSNV